MIQPTAAPVSLISKQQFDSATFALDRFDAIARATLGGVTGSLDYAVYAAQPALGWEYPREGLTGNAPTSSRTAGRSTARSSSTCRGTSTTRPDRRTPIFYPIGYSFGLGYKDECTTFTVRYSTSISAPIAYAEYEGAPLISNPSTRTQTLMFSLVLRTLGDVKTNVGL